jgi:N-ethylmaleimide reductase
MAPLTRMRATNPERAPTALHAEYYAQRASAGLIISEGTFVSPASVGWARVPGLWSAAQVAGWRLVTEAVHRAAGRIFAQLWHTGSLSHPDFYDGELPPAPSPINPGQRSVTPTGKKDTVVPREMSVHEIRDTVRDFGHAARNAMEAGFDGVQIQGGFHYLFNQFLHPRTNVRRDAYGGSIEKRARFLFEVIEEVARVVDRGRIGVKTGPATLETGAFVSGDETLPTFEHVIGRLNDYELSHHPPDGTDGRSFGYTDRPPRRRRNVPSLSKRLSRHRDRQCRHRPGSRESADKRRPRRSRGLWPAVHCQS